jgi:integrase
MQKKLTKNETWAALLSSVAPTDRDNYKAIRTQFEALAQVPVHSARVEHVRQYRASLAGLAPATIVAYNQRLKRIYLWYSSAGHSPRDNPFASVLAGRVPRPIPRRPQPALTPAQLRRLLDIPKTAPHYERDRLILSLLFRVGLRSAEVRKLDVADVKIVGSGVVLRLRETKCGQNQEQLLPADIGRMALKYAKKLNQSGKLFPAIRGGPRRAEGRPISYRYVLELCHRRAAAAGIERIGTHSGRATVATGLLEAGTPPRDVMHWLRHQSIGQTMKYDRGGGEAQRRVARRI